MRIAFIGAVEFSRHCLEELFRQGGEVVTVVTLDPAKAARHSDYSDLGPLAEKHGVPVIRTTNSSDAETAAALRAARPDVIFVFGWSQMIGPAIREIAPCIGTHPALLPANRGRHPIIWALVNDLAESGLTFFYLDEGVDSGDIVWQGAFRITDQDDAGTLLDRISSLAREAIGVFLPQLLRGTVPRIPQDHGRATYWRKRSAADGEIPWHKSARDCFNLIRALARPYPGAHTAIDGEKVTIWKSRIAPDAKPGKPGMVIAKTAAGWLAGTADGVLEILESDGPPLRAGAQFTSLLPALTT